MHTNIFLILAIGIPLYAGDTIIEGETITKKVQTYLTPISEFGSIHIITKSSNSIIYLDGIKVGNNSCVIDKVPVGQHEVYVSDGEESRSKTVYVLANIVRKVEISLKREIFVNVTSSFSQIISHNLNAYGPSLDIGIKYKKSYYGLNYHWNFLGEWNTNYGANNESYALCFGGAAFQWYYTVYEVPGIFEVSPGLGTGFWYFNGNKYKGIDTTTYITSDNYTFYEELFFGGPSIRASIGYKFVFFNVGYTLLCGTKFGNIIILGINLNL